MSLADRMPSTARRVESNTDESLNERNRQRIRESVARFDGADAASIDARIRELQQEWDMERALEANAASVALLGLGLGFFADRRWFLLPAAVAAFLLQHAVQGWCPPVGLFRRLGIRTQAEIGDEILALRILRGDFKPTSDAGEALRQVLH